MKHNCTWCDLKNIVLVSICILALAAIGCRSLVDRLTPAEMPDQTSQYLGVEHSELVSLHDLKNYKDQVIILHRDTQTDLLRMAQDDDVHFQDVIAFTQQSINQSQQIQDAVVGSEDQPFSLLGVLGGMAGGTAIGRALKRKGDYSPVEVEQLLKAKNDTNTGATA